MRTTILVAVQRCASCFTWVLGMFLLVNFGAPTATQVQAATLIGSTVTGTLYYPDLSTILNVSTPITTTVSAAVEFPNGTLVGNTPFTIDITSDQLFYRPLQDVTYGVAAFNGFVFSFVGAPTILGVSIDALSNFDPVSLTFTADSVTFNLSGVTVNTDSVLVIDFNLAATPLPAALPLFATGLGGLGLLGWRRKRKAAAAIAAA